MTELVRRTDGWVDVLPAVGDLAAKIAGTDFVPEAMRGKPAVVAAAVLYGREIGLEPMSALRSINVIKGKPTLSSEAMRALVLAAGHDIRFVEMTSTRCVIEGRRRGQDEPTRVAYSMDDAKKAGLAGQSQYSKMPRQMLSARATAELCRLIFADVLGGLIADVEVDDDVEVVPVAAPATTIQRTRRPKATPEPNALVEPEPEPVVEDEPLIAEDDDVVDAEVVEETPAVPTVESVAGALDAEVIDEFDTPPKGPALLRQALNDAKAGKAPKQITPEQMKAMQATFREIDPRSLPEERREIARVLAGRDVLASASDLTATEAGTVIDGLKAALNTSDPKATLTEALR